MGRADGQGGLSARTVRYVYTILRSALELHTCPVTLFYANRDRPSTIFADELDRLGLANLDEIEAAVSSLGLDVQFERTGADGDLANRTLVTPNAPQWDVGPQADGSIASACGTSLCMTLDLSHLGADWQRYRYRVYDTVIPLRNAVWNP